MAITGMRSWNPIWFAKTHMDEAGWTAEVKIPLSQLRYGNEPDKVWGLQINAAFLSAKKNGRTGSIYRKTRAYG